LNILFTCAGRRVALLEGFRRAMDQLQVKGAVLAADLTSASAAFHTADEGFLVPAVDSSAYVPALKDICGAHEVGLLIPLTDLDLPCLSRSREEFAAAGCEVMIGPPETVQLCRDKTLTNEYLGRIGLRTIRTFRLEQFRAEPFFPCFIKPIRGSASIGTGVLHSEAELKAHLSTFGDLMLVQDYVPGSEYTLDIYRTRAGEVACVVPRQRLAIRAGEVEKGLTVRDEELIACGVKLGENLQGLWGVINAQCRRPPGSAAHFFEINPRFGGGAPLAIAAGADLPRYVLEERLGLSVSARLGEFTPHLLMLRYDQGAFVQVDDPTKLPGYETPEAR
jgi:carbamoyl-phosphate synthase large subunit